MRIIRSNTILLIAILLMLSSCSPSKSSPTISPSTTPAQTLSVHFIDVRQGDSILIDLGETEVLIDGGERNTGAADYINPYVDGALEVMVATHTHADHIGGLIDVLAKYQVNDIWLNSDTATTATFSTFMNSVNTEGATLHLAELGNTIQVGILKFNVLNSAQPLFSDANNNSIVLSLSYGDVDFLFTGDAESEAEGKMLIQSIVPVPDVEILKVGHHCSRTASSPQFLNLVKPDVAIYSCGVGNSYGHPHQETLVALDGIGAKIYGTDVHGTVVVNTDGIVYNVQTEKQASLVKPAIVSPTPTPPPTTAQTTIPFVTQPTQIPTTAPAAASFNFKEVLFGTPSSLSLNLQSLDQTSGKVVINGYDGRRPTIPFTFNWGDGKTSEAFFPAEHVYSNSTGTYVVTVTAHYNDSTTDSQELTVSFVATAPTVNKIPLPEDIWVSIPANPLSLTSHMPGYMAPSGLTYFDDTYFSVTPRSTVEYVLTVVASIQMDFANDDVYKVDGGFRQVVLRDPEFGGMYSLWFTSPVSFGVNNSGFSGTPQYSSFMHEMGHNVTLNSPAGYFYGGKIDGNANAIYSEAMAQIFAHATAYVILNNAEYYGLSPELASDIKESTLSSMRIVRTAYEMYISGDKHFASWNDSSTQEDETFNTFMTIAYKFFEHAENGLDGYRIALKRMMTLLQTFDESMNTRFDQSHNTDAAANFRSTLMVAALSYAFETDLRAEFRALNFPIDDQVYVELYSKADSSDSH
jgi:competence protein ComEC